MRYIPNGDLEIYTDPEANVNFISIIDQHTDFEQLICDAYNSSYIWNQEIMERKKEDLEDSDYYYSDTENLENWDILIQYTINFSEFYMEDEYNSNETYLDRFTDYMVKQTKFTRVFSNEQYRNNMRFLYQDIYDLEMRLREVLSYIYIKEFYPKLDTFHKKISNRAWEKIKPTENKENLVEESAKLWENIFFRLIFSDYKNITKYNLVKDEEYLDFLYSISEQLEIIEKVRNAVMHFRRLSIDDIQNFWIAKNNILDKIDLFPYWYYAEYELPLEEWKEYEVMLPFRNFEVWKKYKLKSRNWYDAIFVLEDWTEEHLVDKEVEEYFKI